MTFRKKLARKLLQIIQSCQLNEGAASEGKVNCKARPNPFNKLNKKKTSNEAELKVLKINDQTINFISDGIAECLCEWHREWHESTRPCYYVEMRKAK